MSSGAPTCRGRWLVVLAALAGCTCEGEAPLEHADRSDGALPEIDVPAASSPIAIDGRLDEAAWESAASTGAFVQPGDGRPAPASRVQGEVKVTADDTYLYFGFTVFDPDPTTPFSRNDVDPHLWEDASGVEVMLQPGDPGDNRVYFEVQVDTEGAVWDTRFDDYNQPISDGPDGRRFGHQAWSSEAERAAHLGDDRYELEIALPWSALAQTRAPTPPRPGDVWRANFYTFRDGQRDALAWSPILGEGNFHRVSRFGRLRF